MDDRTKREETEKKAWDTLVSGAECFRKGNIRIFGNIRLLRFKTGIGDWTELPLHPSETLLKTFRVRRTAWALVRQNGELDERQVPIASDRDVFVRLKLALKRAVQAPALFAAGLFTRRRRYSHFLLLGWNCEVAYRYLRANGFLDSTFFAWAGGLDCEGMLNALRHFDELFTGELAFAPGGHGIFQDLATGVRMHSHWAPSADGTLPDIEEMKSELRSRAAHLREKFYRQLRDDEPTLAVMKLKPADCPKGDFHARRLLAQLREMGGRNLQLLIICQRADAVHFPAEHPDYFLRTVSRYNPDWQVVTEQLGDRFGWMRIWREFVPMHVLKQNKKYKFDR